MIDSDVEELQEAETQCGVPHHSDCRTCQDCGWCWFACDCEDDTEPPPGAQGREP